MVDTSNQPPYGFDFFETITNVNWGASQWLSISQDRVDNVGGPINASHVVLPDGEIVILGTGSGPNGAFHASPMTVTAAVISGKLGQLIGFGVQGHGGFQGAGEADAVSYLSLAQFGPKPFQIKIVSSFGGASAGVQGWVALFGKNVIKAGINIVLDDLTWRYNGQGGQNPVLAAQSAEWVNSALSPLPSITITIDPRNLTIGPF